MSLFTSSRSKHFSGTQHNVLPGRVWGRGRAHLRSAGRHGLKPYCLQTMQWPGVGQLQTQWCQQSKVQSSIFGFKGDEVTVMMILIVEVVYLINTAVSGTPCALPV